MTTIKPRTILITPFGGNTVVNTLQVGAHTQIMTTDEQQQLLGEGQPRKRQRLTHLSPEERMMRRKLKNRVAAQLARDRKREKMDGLDTQLLEVQEENLRLMEENEALRKRTEELCSENSGLKQQLKGGSTPVVAASVKSETLSLESAAGQDRVNEPHNGLHNLPLPPSNAQSDLFALLEEIAHPNALLKTKALVRKSDEAKKPKIQHIAPRSANMVGASATELESLKELIKFDHIYYKSPTTKNTVPEVKQVGVEKMVVVSLPDTLPAQTPPAMAPGESPQVKPEMDSEVDIMKFMDADIIESLSELLNLDGMLDTVCNIPESKPVTVTTNLNQTSLIYSSRLPKVSVLPTNSFPKVSEPSTDTTTVAKRGKKRPAPEVLDDHSLNFLTVPGDLSLDSVKSPSDSGYSSEDFFAGSPESLGSPLGPGSWEESFTELFPSLL